ncbi:MAG: hypothetical protein H0U77_02570 [Nocardioidaceae bacterium]|nr:hypothetical protein [Nocardioidaceae bacterium]
MRDHEEVSGLVPSACTLPTAAHPVRVAEFDDLFRAALRTTERCGPTRLVLTFASAPGRVEMVRDLTEREAECCSFLTFALAEHADLLLLEVIVSSPHIDVLDAIAERALRVSGLVG